MRCPKCGYISFDQQEACPKCSKSLKDSSGELKGTGVRVEKTSYLKSVLEESEKRSQVAGDYDGEAEENVSYLTEVESQEEETTDEVSEIDFSLEEDEEGAEPEAREEFEELISVDEQAGEAHKLEKDMDEPDRGTENEFQLDFDEIKYEEPAEAELAAGSDEVLPGEEEPARPEEPDLKLQLESDILDEEPDEAGLEYDLENIDMSDLVIEDKEMAEEGEDTAKEKKKQDKSSDDLPDIDL